jgi:hypothetical protein
MADSADKESLGAAAAFGPAAELQQNLDEFHALFQDGNPMRGLQQMFMQFVQEKYAQMAEGGGESFRMPFLINPSTQPLLASDVPSLKRFVTAAIASASNLWRSHTFHAAAAARYTDMLKDPAFQGAGGDASKGLPAGFPKSFIQKPVIFTISEHLPSGLLSTHEAVAATAARAYEKVILTQMSLSKNLAAEELKKICDSHSASFIGELPSFFTENVPAPDRARLIESAKLDYASGVDAAVTKFEMELKDKEKNRAGNMKNLAEQKLKALESKNDATIGHAMDVKIVLNNLALQAKNPNYITELPAIERSAAIVANGAIQVEIQGSLNRKGAQGRQTPGANPQTHLASKKKASKKKKKKKQPLPTQTQQQPQQKPKTSQPKKKKAPKKKGKGSAQQQQKAGRAAASPGAAEQTGNGRKRKRGGAH